MRLNRLVFNISEFIYLCLLMASLFFILILPVIASLFLFQQQILFILIINWGYSSLVISPSLTAFQKIVNNYWQTGEYNGLISQFKQSFVSNYKLSIQIGIIMNFLIFLCFINYLYYQNSLFSILFLIMLLISLTAGIFQFSLISNRETSCKSCLINSYIFVLINPRYSLAMFFLITSLFLFSRSHLWLILIALPFVFLISGRLFYLLTFDKYQ